mgnify:CR=1 FL=1
MRTKHVSTMNAIVIPETDSFIPIMVLGTFFGAALGQPALPIKGGNLIVIAAFQNFSISNTPKQHHAKQ